MHSFRAAIIFALCGLLAGPLTAAQGAQTSGTSTNALTNKDVLEMLRAGLSQEVVIAKIKSSACNLDTSPTALKELNAAHVPKKVVLAMVQAPAVGTPPLPPKAPTRIKLDGQVQAGKIVAQPQPIYPPLARQARIQGNVLLHAIIDKDGRVGALQIVSGHPLLVQAALDAVKNWRYQPVQLNGEPVEVDTTITVTFTLGNAQVAANAPANTGSGRIQNVAPEEMWKRVTQCVFPTYPGVALNSQITGTVDIGLGISPEGEVGITSRVLNGPALLVPSAMDAINRWKFRPNILQGELTWSRVRALVRFNADGTTAVDLAPGILADNFGDPGTPSSAGAAVPKPASAPECKSVNEPAPAPKPNQQPASVPAAADEPEGNVPKTSAAGALSAETFSQLGTSPPGASPDSGPKFVDGAYLAGVGGIGQPSCVFCPHPQYSNQARGAKISGTVGLYLLVTPEGRAANIQIRHSLGYGLDEMAVDAVRDWQFKPVVGPEGKPVPVWVNIQVSFRIR